MESNSVFDAVDGSFTGTEVPSMWAPLRLPRSRTPAEAEAWHAARAVDTVILNAFLGEVVSAMARGDRVDLRGFGAFSIKVRPARTGRNPRTGTIVPVQEKAFPVFRTSKQVRERLNKSR